MLGAVDHGYRVVVLSDGVCSGEDGTHDASLKLLGDTFSVQLALQTTEECHRMMRFRTTGECVLRYSCLPADRARMDEGAVAETSPLARDGRNLK